MAFENLKKDGIKYLLGKLKTVFVQIKDAVKSVNGNTADETGNITIITVPYAQNLESESSQRNTGTYIIRASGGQASIDDGNAWLMKVVGNSVHDGFVAENIDWDLVTVDRENPITAEFNRDVFVQYVENSGTITLVYSTEWSANPVLYGFTISGEPVAGDVITINYTKEVRGTITQSNPQSFTSTGWNLYNHANGYARVVKYSNDYGFRVEGTYSALQFSTTESGTKTIITPNDGNFTIPSNGYVWVIGGNNTDTAIYMTHEDWTEEANDGVFSAYEETVIDMSAIMAENFPNGLLHVGNVSDEIDLNIGQAISRVDRLAYSDENLVIAKASGREYEYDENYIYLAKATATVSSISLDGAYTANDHGIEFFDTDVPVTSQVLYGNNLKNKLERDVVTISQQTLEPEQQEQVRTNIGAGDAETLSELSERFDGVSFATWTASSSSYLDIEQNSRCIVWATSGATTHQGLWIISGLENSTEVMTIQAGEKITVSVSGMRVTWSHSSSRATRYAKIQF